MAKHVRACGGPNTDEAHSLQPFPWPAAVHAQGRLPHGACPSALVHLPHCVRAPAPPYFCTCPTAFVHCPHRGMRTCTGVLQPAPPHFVHCPHRGMRTCTGVLQPAPPHFVHCPHRGMRTCTGVLQPAPPHFVHCPHRGMRTCTGVLQPAPPHFVHCPHRAMRTCTGVLKPAPVQSHAASHLRPRRQPAPAGAPHIPAGCVHCDPGEFFACRDAQDFALRCKRGGGGRGWSCAHVRTRVCM